MLPFLRCWGSFKAGAKLVVVVVDDVHIVDGGCVSVVGGDVAVLGGVPGCSTRLCVVWGVAWVLVLMVEIIVIWVLVFSHGCGCSSFACTAVLQVFSSSVDIPMSFIRCGSSSLGDSICRAPHQLSGTLLICTAILLIPGVVFSFVSSIVAVLSLGNGIVDVVVVTIVADVLGTVITAFMAAIFTLKLSVLLCHFFL